MAQEAPKPHILHLDSLGHFIDFSVSLILPLATRSFDDLTERLLRRPVPRRRFTGVACYLRSLLLSLAPVDSSLSLALRFSVNQTRSRLYRRLSSPALAYTAAVIDVAACLFDESSTAFDPRDSPVARFLTLTSPHR